MERSVAGVQAEELRAANPNFTDHDSSAGPKTLASAAFAVLGELSPLPSPNLTHGPMTFILSPSTPRWGRRHSYM